MKNSFFEISGLSAGYGGRPLIKDINIKLEKGQILTLIGPNGAGKSTILKTITGHLPAISGSVYIGGRKTTEMDRKDMARAVAVLLTERIKTDMMTCRDVVETGRYPYTGSFGLLSDEDHAAADRAMKASGITGLADRDFMTLSDGQKQRVMIARAEAQESDILVLDEPTSFLDIRYQLELMDTLRRLASERGTVVIMSLHELFLAERISDIIMCLKDHRVDNTGTPAEIFSGTYIDSLYDISPGTYEMLRNSPHHL
ncbi:MAG: ABC transporter ATP-binding protein [Anaerovoracaceae bacterium]|jgi:iron complex transport system ATP-binding protein